MCINIILLLLNTYLHMLIMSMQFSLLRQQTIYLLLLHYSLVNNMLIEVKIHFQVEETE